MASGAGGRDVGTRARLRCRTKVSPHCLSHPVSMSSASSVMGQAVPARVGRGCLFYLIRLRSQRCKDRPDEQFIPIRLLCRPYIWSGLVRGVDNHERALQANRPRWLDLAGSQEHQYTNGSFVSTAWQRLPPVRRRSRPPGSIPALLRLREPAQGSLWGIFLGGKAP